VREISAPAASVIFISIGTSIVMTIGILAVGSRYVYVHTAWIASVVIYDIDAGMAGRLMAESVVSASGKAQGPNGQNDK
jgi:hypothetical protein